ncbi:hypothetical protein K0M31_008754 [Melipona bicolor]|uniref:Uncharacterized protein n=1 Tax=Melipona bicolor TaxID=60889 RepID=A0AA40KJV8_9HYME|nr:hypothetical protein K0M31_008754 [Melipona bicolor]
MCDSKMVAECMHSEKKKEPTYARISDPREASGYSINDVPFCERSGARIECPTV